MSIVEKLEILRDIKNDIKQAILDKGVEISDSDSFSSFADKITNIKSSVAGITLDNLYSVDSQGKLKRGTNVDFVCNATELNNGVLQHIGYNNYVVENVSFPFLTKVGFMSLDTSFYNAHVETFNAPLLETVEDYGMRSVFLNSQLNSINLSRLTTVGKYGCYSAFGGTSITTADLSNLTTVDDYGFQDGFNSTNITSIDLSSLTTVGFWAFKGAFANGTMKSLDLGSLRGTLYGEAFGGNSSIRKIWISKELTYIKAANLPTYTFYSYYYAPFKGCSSSLVIYTDAPSKLPGWSEYCFHIDSSTEATVVYGATYEEFLAA